MNLRTNNSSITLRRSKGTDYLTKADINNMASSCSLDEPLDLADSLLIELDSQTHVKHILLLSDEEEVNKMMQEERKFVDPYLLEPTTFNRVPEGSGDLRKDFEVRIERGFRGLQQSLVSYRESLEFTQREVDGLKEENVRLRSKMNELELEEKRNGYQVDRMEEKLDRQDTSARRRNLIIEGIPESNGPNEILQPVIYKLMDQMGVGKDVTYDTAFRIRPYSKNRPRSVLVIFVRLADREEFYSGLMRTWVKIHDAP